MEKTQFSPLNSNHKFPPFPETEFRNFSDSMEKESSNGGGSGPIGLSLELGCGGSSGFSLQYCGFTVLQLQELQLQALIFKYMEAGLPVPQQLVLPIWKSFAFASSHGAAGGGLYQFFPSFFGSRGMHLEYRKGVDPEPGRCRRTDGKKWRCSKDAVVNHKYCERHMHRGKHRSRKLAEATNPTSTTANTNLSISLHCETTSFSSS